MDLNFERWEINSTILLIDGINYLSSIYKKKILSISKKVWEHNFIVMPCAGYVKKMYIITTAKNVYHRYPTNVQSHEIFVMFKLNVKLHVCVYIYSKNKVY